MIYIKNGIMILSMVDGKIHKQRENMILSMDLKQDIIDLVVNVVGTNLMAYILDTGAYLWLVHNFSECELGFIIGDEI